MAKQQTKQRGGSGKSSSSGSSRGSSKSSQKRGGTRKSGQASNGSKGTNSGNSQRRRAPRKTGQGSNGTGQGSGNRTSSGQQRQAAKDADRDRPGSPFKYGTDEGGKNQTGGATVPEREYQDYTMLHPGSISDSDEPDVLVDIPVVEVEEIHFELDNLMARVSLHAEVLDLVKLSVGVHAELGKVELNIKGVEAQALLRARLDHVTAIVDRVLTTLDRNPKVLESIGQSLERVGEGAGKGVGQIGEGAGKAVEDVGEGAGSAVKDVGKGAGGAVEDVGEGAGGAVENVGEGAGGAVEDVGDGGGEGGNGLTAGKLAKEAAKILARELGSAASDEAKELGLAATTKATELGERRRQRRAEKHNATEAALR